jgi:hypothetical protein
MYMYMYMASEALVAGLSSTCFNYRAYTWELLVVINAFSIIAHVLENWWIVINVFSIIAHVLGLS